MESTHTENIVAMAADLAGKADEIDAVLVIYQKKEGGFRSLDNGIRAETAVFLVEVFKQWLFHAMVR